MALLLLILATCIYTTTSSFAPFTSIQRYYVSEDSNRMAHFYWEGTKLRCDMYGDSEVIQEALASRVDGSLGRLDDSTLKFVLDICTRVEMRHMMMRGTEMNVSRAIIYPGTKWCGAGTVAEDWDDLGEHWETDSCCREHDFCPDFILKGEEKYGLYNRYIGTVSHCDCDAKFINCLKESNHHVSDNVGKIFFSFLAVPCFQEDHPIVKCLEYGGPGGRRCIKYEVDYLNPKMWQFFDAKIY